LRDVDTDRRIILKGILEEQVVNMWNRRELDNDSGFIIKINPYIS
jgi:hypothetical protein